jgi:hypothetical protein
MKIRKCIAQVLKERQCTNLERIIKLLLRRAYKHATLLIDSLLISYLIDLFNMKDKTFSNYKLLKEKSLTTDYVNSHDTEFKTHF